MKKIILLVLVSVIYLAVVACGANPKVDSGNNQSQTPVAEKDSTENNTNTSDKPAASDETALKPEQEQTSEEQNVHTPQSIDEKIASLKPGQAYAIVDIDEYNAALLVTEGTFDNGDGKRAAIDAVIYGYDMKENFMEYGRVESDGTAYPLSTKDGCLYFGGNHHMGMEYIDADKAILVVKEEAMETFDENGKATYTYICAAGDKDETVADDSKLKALFEEYSNTEVVYFTTVE